MNLDSVLEHHAGVEEFRRRHRTGLVTLLFTDIVGSTKLKQNLGDQEGLMLIQRHHTVIRDILGSFKQAEEIKTAGDSFFIVFATPSDAVKFCLLLQSKLRTLAKETGVPVLDRVGIHVGEVFIEDEAGAAKSKDLFGIQVDTCARVMSLAHGDQILMTRFAFDNARQVLKGQDIREIGPLSWLNHGRYQLKGVDDPLEVCEVGETGRARLQPPASSEKAQPYVSADSEPVLGWRPALGQVVPNTQWVLEEKLGEGGFGEVWLGRHASLKQRRVFKFCFRADRVRSLKREVTLFRLLKERVGDHPNIVAVQDVFLSEPPFYLVMDYAGGKDLKSWSEAQGGLAKIPLAVRLEIVAQVADALQAAHDAGVIHRDLKPSNILICQPPASTSHGSPIARLTDFGIGQVVSAEVLSDVTNLGFTQTLVTPGSASQSGTFIYMAPELLSGKPALPHSDVYSLGVVFFQMLVGDFSRPVTPDWSDAIADPLLMEDLKRCFAGNIKSRFAHARELAASLRSLEKRRAALAKDRAARAAQAERAVRWNDWRLGAVGAVLIAFLGLFCLVSPFDLGLARLSYDLPFVFRPEIKVDEAMIVYMDDESHARLKQPFQARWDRALHVQLLKELTARGAQAVVFDILFRDESGQPSSVDDELAAAIKAHGKVALAAKEDVSKSPGLPTIRKLLRAEEPLGSAAPWGVEDLPQETDLTIRRHRREGENPSLAWQAAELLGRAPPDKAKQRWLNFYGPRGAIPFVSYYQVLETNTLGPDSLKGKVVFVGHAPVLTYQGLNQSDEHRTPYTRWTGRMSPGVEVQATAFLNLVRRDWLEELSPVTELMLFILIGGAIGYGFAITKPWLAALFGVGGAAAIGVGGCFLVWEQHLWFPWLTACAVQIPCALGWSALANTRRLYLEKALWQAAPTVALPQTGVPASSNEMKVGTASNIIFVKGDPKFADIGLVTELGEAGADKTYVGTEGYIPPEGPGTVAADVYSLGKVLYEASLGRDGKHSTERPTTPAGKENQDDLLRFKAIILKACEADPTKRYKSAAEMQADLAALRVN